MKWISVKDKLPEEDQEILVYFSKKSFFLDGRWVPSQKVLRYGRLNKRQPLSFIGDNGYSFSVVFWMPLPKPPKD